MPEPVNVIVLDAFKVSTHEHTETISLVKVMTRDPVEIPEQAEFMIVVNEVQFDIVDQALESLGPDELAVVTVDRENLIPTHSVEPCPLCGAENQLVRPLIEAALVSKSCDECGQTLSANNLPPELQDMLDTTVDVYEAVTGRPFFGDPPSLDEES